MTLLPLGLYYGADVTGRDPSKWKVIGWFYNNKFYATADEFRAASKSANFTKLPANIDGQWGWTDKQGEPMTFDDLPPPAPVAQGHQRFSVDPAENYVSWSKLLTILV